MAMSRRAFLGGLVGLVLTANGVVKAQRRPRVFKFKAGAGGGSDVLYDGLTPTIYAAPTTQGTGSGNSEANAMALQDAIASASASSIIGCVPGVYALSRAGTDDRWLPIYFLENSGSSAGSPTTVVGKYDHLLYYTDAAKRCELQNTTASTVSPWNDPGNRAAIGCYARNNQKWVNFYIDTSNVPSYPDKGSVVCNQANNITFRKIVFNRTLGYNGADNYDCFFLQASDNVTVEYCYATGHVGTSHRNISVVKTYSCTNFTIRYNSFNGVCQCIYIKGDVLGGGQSGTIYGNKSVGNTSGMIAVGVVRSPSATTNTVTVHHNLSIRDAEGLRYESSGDSGTSNAGRKFYNNTIVDATGSLGGGAIYSNDSTFIADEFYNNVVAFTSSTAQNCIDWQTSASISVLNYNLYYEAGATPTFNADAATWTGLASWQGHTSAEANSSVGDPVFDNAGADNYKRTSSGDTGSSTGGKRGCYETGSEQIGAFAA